METMKTFADLRPKLLAIDRLRIAQRERETYTGYWLPEPVVSVEEHSPEAAGLLAGEVSYALQWLLERLTPSERAAFLLRSVFDREYDEIAAILQKTETACRQLVSRATQRLQDERVRFQPSPEAQKRLLERFVAAARSGELAALQALIDENAALVGDGGGKVPSFRHILRGRLRVASLYFAMSRKYGTKVAYRLAWVPVHVTKPQHESSCMQGHRMVRSPCNPSGERFHVARRTHPLLEAGSRCLQQAG